ncbi:MAG: 2-C-methyl-D-erythritol 4-phosphate cytidylyltransferase, partial [Gammaproteobacteria bacterium]|nr:2-C-methyl-D-erythritol 4-phosphate cytidylyltransferase [Gammaproteobacteria bacterium]
DQTALVARVLDTWAGDVQVGGGLRDDGAIERVFAAGASRAVVGTRAVEDCTWLASAASRWPGRIMVALDARGREVLARGWTAGTGTDVVTLAAELSELPLAGLLVTAVANEGRLAGPDLETTSAVAAACSLSVTASGGIERAESVLNALDMLREHAVEDDWVLVHDAARPCVRTEDLNHLVTALRDDAVGGLLAIPVRDTMKQADAEQRCNATVDRSRLWHALTPQMFRLGALRDALRSAAARGVVVTDDASAMEQAGLRPRLIEGHADNLKITRPEDLALAEFYLRQQGRL